MAVRHPKLLILAEWLEVTNYPRQDSALLGVTMPDAGAHGFMWSSLLAVQSPVKYVAEKLFTSFRYPSHSGSIETTGNASRAGKYHPMEGIDVRPNSTPFVV